jgi:hypothetical protein
MPAVNIKNIGTVMTIVGLSFSTVAAAAGREERPLSGGRAPVESLATALPKLSVPEPQVKRPVLLPALYVSLGVMQAWDAHSTSAALKAGAREANPTAAPFAGNRGSMLGLKAVTTASTIFFAERMWKKNRTGAIVMMAVINGATAAVAMHNMNNARLVSTR